MEFHATAKINATPERIWEILTNASGYPEWDSGVAKVVGRIAPGETIKVFTELSPEQAFPVKVGEFVPAKKMVWTGGMPLGLFKGERTFTLHANADGSAEFSMREVYSGALLAIFGRTVPDLQPSFEQFAAGLKARAEGV